ncbi:hypothetical protein R1flu_025570 [Riccia fluitans]|uniref:Uncharacterized protein n=1 Tax=Riccia fluitans TaxID=41844 RepID=A0ABD1XZ13_9MARC
MSTRRPRAEDKLPEEIPIAFPEQPLSTKRPCVEDKERGLPSTKKNKRHSAAIDTWKKAYEDKLSKVCELQETNDGLRGQLVAKDAKKLDVQALARTEVQRELEELKRSVTKLKEFKRSATTKEKAAKKTHLQKLAQVQTKLEEYKRSSEAKEKAAEETHLQNLAQALENAHQKEISTLKSTYRKYKATLDGEIGTNADLHARVQNLEDELNASKYTHEQALQAQKAEVSPG